jgi:hypothetical protein
MKESGASISWRRVSASNLGRDASRSRLKEEKAPDSMQTRAEASSRVIDNDVASQASVVFTIAAAVMFKPPRLESCVMVSRVPFGQ